jgi:hypothetical protein
MAFIKPSTFQGLYLYTSCTGVRANDIYQRQCRARETRNFYATRRWRTWSEFLPFLENPALRLVQSPS